MCQHLLVTCSSIGYFLGVHEKQSNEAVAGFSSMQNG